MKIILYYLAVILLAFTCVGCSTTKKNAEKSDIKANTDIAQVDTFKSGHSENKKTAAVSSKTDDTETNFKTVHVEYTDSGKIKSVTWSSLLKNQKSKSEKKINTKSEVKDTLSSISATKLTSKINSKVEVKGEESYKMGDLDAWIGVILVGILFGGIIVSKIKP